jgi:hypothetical protein
MFAIPPYGHAEEPAVVTVAAEGFAAIVQGNTAMARDQAINDALRRAVEQTVGTMISSDTVVENYVLLSDRIYSRSQGYVQSYQIVSEGPAGENLYRVQVQAGVATGTLKNDLAALGILIARKNMPRVMIMVAEQNVGYHHYYYWWGLKTGEADLSVTENILMEKLLEKGFNVVDHTIPAKTKELSNAYRIVSLDNNAISRIGKLYNAEVVIYGKALAKLAGSIMGTSMKSSQADISLRVVNTDNGQEIASATHNGSAVHVNEVTAGTEAIRKTTEELSETLITQIAARWSKDVNAGALVQLIVSGCESYKTLVAFKDVLQNRVRGVNGVYQRAFDAGTATLDVETTGSAQMLADALSVIDYKGFTIEVTKISQNSIRMTITER